MSRRDGERVVVVVPALYQRKESAEQVVAAFIVALEGTLTTMKRNDKGNKDG